MAAGRSAEARPHPQKTRGNFSAAIAAEKERQYTNKKDLSEDRVNEINDILCELQPGDDVEVGYYCQYGKTYRKVTGVLRKIDCYWKTVVIESTTISFGEIDSIVVKSNYTLI